MVYVDALRDWGWRLGPSSHLMADTTEELHAFALSIGCKRRWFQPLSPPHYDITARLRALAVRKGAKELNRGEFVALIRRLRTEGVY